MGTVDPHTTGGDPSLDLITALIKDPELEARFPDRAAFVSSDSPSFSALVSEAAGEGRPVVVAFPGGGYMILEGRPPAETLVGELHLV
ncbi:MAG TPA: hypothetical protein VGX16_05290 [Solirubrobacteraceae bacterium]|nr:hypothetical protein [Solirubrobacteraceae bacterium]